MVSIAFREVLLPFLPPSLHLSLPPYLFRIRRPCHPLARPSASVFAQTKAFTRYCCPSFLHPSISPSLLTSSALAGHVIHLRVPQPVSPHGQGRSQGSTTLPPSIHPSLLTSSALADHVIGLRVPQPLSPHGQGRFMGKVHRVF